METHTFGTHALPRAVSPQPVPAGATTDHPALFLNGELGWIDFNWRVLALALDSQVPLLERVRFIAIAANNLDEFTQKRIGGLKRVVAAGVIRHSPDGRTPAEQLDMISRAAVTQHRAITHAWEKVIKPLLAEKAGVVLGDYAELSPRQRGLMRDHFQSRIYPTLTPLAVDPGRPFPFISNFSLSLAVTLRGTPASPTSFVRVKIPTDLDRWILVGAKEGEREFYLPIEQLIAAHVDELFRGKDVVGVYPFRVTRNADLRRDEEEADDLLALISEEIRNRRHAPVVRLEVSAEMPSEVRRFLLEQLALGPGDLYEVDGMLDLTGCNQIANLDLVEHRYRRWEPVVPRRLSRVGDDADHQNIFGAIREGDILVHHPYESFTASAQRLLDDAAEDDRVLAVKQTIYRTSQDDSPIVDALVRAAANGKQVAALVEIKARFDEANNIEWGKMLENAGVHVAYGLVGLKTHAKAALVVRQEEDGLRTYCHLGTGNYHPGTAKLYTDFGLLTCDPDIGRDVVGLFHHLTGSSPGQQYGKLVVSPRDMRGTFERLINQEIDAHRAHANGRILAKMNALDDAGIIRELYRASQAGVQIDLIVRGQSLLRPGLPGFSENVRIISILGRFLEHDRVYCFNGGGERVVLIGSADWRRRNLEDRVEALVPIEDPVLQDRIVAILEEALEDNVLAWDMDSDGSYARREPGDGPVHNLHDTLMRRALRETRR